MGQSIDQPPGIRRSSNLFAWELMQKGADAMAVVTISRQYGSEGEEIAGCVCQLLGYQYFDKQLMAKVAGDVGIAENEIVDFSEDQHRVRGFLDRLLGSPRPVVAQAHTWEKERAGVRTPSVYTLDEAQSIALVQATIRAAYMRGNVVILGRGGQAVLKTDPGVLHLRIEAPLEARVQRVQLREGLTIDLAREVVMERDRASADYLKRFYGVEWSNPALYHLVLNAGRWGIESAGRLIAKAVNLLQPVTALN